MKNKVEFDYKRYLPFLLCFILILVLVVKYKHKIFNLLPANQFFPKIESNKNININVFAIDEQKKLSSLYLLSFNPNTRRTGIVYFPVNTLLMRVSNSRVGLTTLDELYKEGNWKAVRDSLENSFNRKIPFYIKCDSKSFMNIIDILGGIKLRINNSIKYYNKSTDKWYLIPSGSTKLFGPKIVEYLEYKKIKEDLINLTYRKGNFIKSFFDDINDLADINEQEVFVKTLYGFLNETNITFENFFEIVQILTKIKSYDVKFDKVEGEIVTYKDKEAIRMSVIKIDNILPKNFDALLNVPKKKYITVEILNGTKIRGMAEKLRRILQNYVDIDVQSVGNADSEKKYDNTQIIDKSGNLKSAQRIKEILGLGEIKRKVETSSFVDVEIIIGKDIKNME